MAAECPSVSAGRAFAVYLIVTLGILLTWTVLLLLLWTIKYKMDQTRRKDESVILPCAIAISLSLERLTRLPEHIMRFNGPREGSDTLYYFANTFLTAASALLFYHSTIGLRRCFKDSRFEVPSETISNIYVVSGVSVACLLGWTVTNGIPRIYKSGLGQIVLNVLSLVAVGSALLALLWINYAFSTRLKAVVTENMVNQGLRTPRSPLTPQPGSEMKSPGGKVMKRSITTMFKGSDQRMLRLASKSTVISLWNTCCLISLFISAALFSFGDCADGWSLAANTIALMAIPTVALCTYLGLKECADHYQVVCQLCDGHIGKRTAKDTGRRVSAAYINDEENNAEQQQKEQAEVKNEEEVNEDHTHKTVRSVRSGSGSGVSEVDSTALGHIVSVQQQSANEITVTEALTDTEDAE